MATKTETEKKLVQDSNQTFNRNLQLRSTKLLTFNSLPKMLPIKIKNQSLDSKNMPILKNAKITLKLSFISSIAAHSNAKI